MTALYENVLKVLSKYRCEYDEFQHEPVYTSETASVVMDHPEEQGTKSLAMTPKKGTEGAVVVVTVAGNERMDFKRAATAVDMKKLSMAPESTVSDVLGTEIGGLAPFGYESKGVRLVVSKTLLNQDLVYINPGKNDVTIRIKGGDFAKLMRAEGAVVLPNE